MKHWIWVSNDIGKIMYPLNFQIIFIGVLWQLVNIQNRKVDSQNQLIAEMDESFNGISESIPSGSIPNSLKNTMTGIELKHNQTLDESRDELIRVVISSKQEFDCLSIDASQIDKADKKRR